MNNKRSRKWHITINNPNEKGFNEEQLYTLINNMDDFVYCCYCYETGEQGTHHVHIYLKYENARRFSTMQNKFIGSHLEPALGTSKDNRDYIRKEGKYLNSEKHTTNHIETFREFGECPLEEPGKRNDLYILYEMIEDGCSTNEIIQSNPNYINQIDNIPKIRSAILEDKYSNEIRDVEVTYIWGDSGAGKTTYVAKKYGYPNIYRTTDYKHPFDNYNGQDVLVFEEFRSQIEIYNMLNYLDRHPCVLPCRYANKQACYTKIFIITNIPIERQYVDEQNFEYETFKAFMRRIHHFIEFTNGEIRYFDNYFDIDCKNYKLIEEKENIENEENYLEREI